MELTSATSFPSFGNQPCVIALQAIVESALLLQQNVPHEAEPSPPPPPPPVLKNESDCQLPWATDAEIRQAIQQAEAECAVTLTPEQRAEDERRARRAAYVKRWSPEPHAREADLVLPEVDYDDAASDYWTQKAARALCPPTPKPLPPSAPPAPTQAQAASEAPLTVDGARRSSNPNPDPDSEPDP